MAHVDLIMPSRSAAALPTVRKLRVDDLKLALAQGVDDFWAMPTHTVFLGLIYPVAGLLLGSASFSNNFIPLLYPMAAGFALIGPIGAIWLYELSRRRELGLDTSWRHAFDVFHSPSLPSIAALGILLLAIFAIWIASAQAIYQASFGYQTFATVDAFARAVATTPEGRAMIVVGNLVGLLFAALAAMISVVAFPLLLDREAGFAAAIATSTLVVTRNPGVMALWGLIVAGGLVLGSLPFFIGLAVVVPILGHATWHLYRRAVAPDDNPRPEYRPPERGKRFAADFPASLFTSSRMK